jgi:hypothetical protein
MARNQHEWSFVRRTKQGELAYCKLCDRFRLDKGKPFKMSDPEDDYADRAEWKSR